jgi:hypothetical protein
MKAATHLTFLLMAAIMMLPAGAAARGRLSCNSNNPAIADACNSSDVAEAQNGYEQLLNDINSYRVDGTNRDWLAQRARELDNRLGGDCQASWQFRAGCEVDAYNQAITALDSLRNRLRDSGQRIRTANVAPAASVRDAAPENAAQTERQTQSNGLGRSMANPEHSPLQANTEQMPTPAQATATPAPYIEAMEQAGKRGEDVPNESVPTAGTQVPAQAVQQEDKRSWLWVMLLIVSITGYALRKPLVILARRAASRLWRG